MNYDVGVVTRQLFISPDPLFGVPTATAAAGAWATLYSHSYVSSTAGLSGFTIRSSIDTSLYDGGAPATGTQLRVTIRGGSPSGLTWDGIYVGHAAAAGDAWDFDGTQVQLLFSGSGSGTLAASTSVLSDAVTYSFDKTKRLVISTHYSGASSPVSGGGVTGISSSFKAAASEAGITDVSGFGADPGGLYLFTLVEVFG